MVIAGFTSQCYFTINRIMVIQETDRAFYGRVMSVYMMTWALTPVAVLPMGALVDHIGAPLTVGGAGALLALAIAATTIFGRESREIGHEASHAAPASD
jgi:hypothetical protein